MAIFGSVAALPRLATAQDTSASARAAPQVTEPALAPSPAEKPWTAGDTRVAVTVERITGIIWFQSETQVDSVFGHFERERSGTQFHALAASGATGDGEDGVTFSGIPRIAIDFVLPVQVTLGAVAGVLSTTGKEEVTIDDRDQPRIHFPDTTTVLLGGRLGYLWAISENVALWPRIGATYASQMARGSAGSEQTIRATQLLFDPALVLTPVPHVGVLFYPIIDVGLGGSVTTKFSVSGLDRQTTEGTFRTTSFGGALALSAFF